MAKETGITMACVVDDSAGSPRTISNDILSLDFATPRNVQEVTGLDKTAMERLLLLADFTCSISGAFNDASNLSFAVFKTVSSTSVARTVVLTVSDQSLECETFFTDFAWTRATTGEFTFTAPGVLTGGTAPTWA